MALPSGLSSPDLLCCGPLVTPAFIHSVEGHDRNNDELMRFVQSKLDAFMSTESVPVAPYNWDDIVKFQRACALLFTELQKSVGAPFQWIGTVEDLLPRAVEDERCPTRSELDAPLHLFLQPMAKLGDQCRCCSCVTVHPFICCCRAVNGFYSRPCFRQSSDDDIVQPFVSRWSEFGQRGRYLIVLQLYYCALLILFETWGTLHRAWIVTMDSLIEDGLASLWN